jgi:hypothetical protein
MNKDNLKFPYPVLGHVDDIDSDWGCTYSAICDDEEIRFIVEIENNFDDLHDLIIAHKACYACEIICGRTFIRRAERSYDDKFEIKIPRNEIRDTLSLTLHIISTEEQKMYTSDKFKEVYRRSANFLQPLEVGEILGQLPEYTLPVDIEYDNINSTPLIEIKKEACEFEYIRLNSDTIQVILPELAFEKLNLIKDRYLNIYYSSFIFNALIQAVPEIDQSSDKTWAQKLAIILQDDKFNGLDKKTDTSEIVQKILNNPYSNMIDSLLNLNI